VSLLRKQLTSPLVWIPAALLEMLADEARLSRPLETGGMLVGWRVGSEIVVTGMIPGGPNARHARDAFHPDGTWQQQRLEEIYRGSTRTVTFLGDWHSHPRGRPSPSQRDRETAAAVSGCREARTQQPITLIVGRRAGKWRSRCFVFVGGRLQRARVRVHETV
jgi:integrative and conjugative element protein (TIGR02256 family)